jgi:peptidoglycan/xylan/chitin deacetylase (PgdA/CDA1 family)
MNRLMRKLPARVWQNLMGTVTEFASQDAVALTFDDGPHPKFTPRVLEILKVHKARATFFMIGELADRYPELVRQVAEAGHAVANHSWDHPSFPLISWRERRAQIRACERAIAPYGVRLFRPPYGHQDLASRLVAFFCGYQVVTWSVVAHDWIDHDATSIAERVMTLVRSGSVILLHDGLYDFSDERYTDRHATCEAVDKILSNLKSRFEFLTIPDMLRRGLAQRVTWYRESDRQFLNGLKRGSGQAPH